MSTTDRQTKPHISATQLDMYWRCPESWKRRYLEGEIIPPAMVLLQGGAIHVGAEVNGRQKIESHVDLPAKEIVDAAVSEFDTKLAGGYQLTAEEQSRGAPKVIGEMKDQTAALAELHALKQAPEYQPIAVECKSRIRFPAAPRDLLTVTDLRDDQGRVVDWKTAKRRASQADADSSIQLTLYAAAFQIDTGSPAASVRLDQLIKNKKPVRHVTESTRGPADFQAAVNRVNATLAAMETGIFSPASPGSWWCGPDWCGYWATCPFVNSERKAKAAGK